MPLRKFSPVTSFTQSCPVHFRAPALVCGAVFSLLVCFAAVCVWPAQPKFAENRILVKARDGVAREKLNAAHKARGAEVIHEYKRVPGLQLVRLPKGMSVAAAIAHYKKSGLFAFAEPDYVVSVGTTPNDPRFLDGTLWAMRNTGQDGGTPGADIRAVDAWDTRTDGSSVLVAVIDTGVRYTHEDLAASMWMNPGETGLDGQGKDKATNGIDDDGNGYVDDVHGINAITGSGNPDDDHGHGTHVSGTIGGVGNNAKGVVGVCWQAKIMALKFLDSRGSGYVSDAITCIDYAISKGAKVLNNSWGGGGYSQALYEAISRARSAGIIFVASAGNAGSDNDTMPYYPASYNLDNIVAVAATDRNDNLAFFSNYGANSVRLGAPGVSIYSCANGGDSSYTTKSGTSMAAPHVSGALALMWAQFPGLTYQQIITRLLGTTDPIPSLTGKTVSGGRLNLHRALTLDPVADFTAVPVTGEPPLTVTFTDNSFGTIETRSLNFGDGSPPTPTTNTTHTYTSTGDYTATLTVSGPNGTDSKTRLISVFPNYIMSAAPFSWIDPGTMTRVSLSDDSAVGQSLPFTFRFYGRDYSVIYIGSNGLVGFDVAGMNAWTNTDLPEATAPNNIICPYWDDLNPGAAGSVSIGVIGTAPHRMAVISWVGVPHFSNANATFSFQVLLFETSNDIKMQFLEVQPDDHSVGAGRSATVGVENSPGTVARKYGFNGSSLLGNNQAILFSMGLRPDLAVTGVSVAPTVGAPGAAGTLAVTITNTGQAASDACQLDCWFESTVAPSCGSTGSVTDTVGALEPGASLTLHYPFTFPSSPGEHTAVAFVDSQCAVIELDENNNQAAAIYTVALPDLAIQAVSLDKGSYTPGQTGTATVTIRNLGSVSTATGFSVDFYVSISDAVDCGAEGDVHIDLPALDADGTVTVDVPFTAPVETGSHTFAVFADPSCVLAEYDETNNQGMVAYAVVRPADLVVAEFFITPTNAPPDTPATLTVTVANIGSLTVSDFQLDCWFDRESTPHCGQTGSVTEFITALEPGATATFTYPLTFPSQPASLTAWAFVDSQCTVWECDETNNQASVSYVAVNLPDLLVSAMTLTPASGPPGSPASLGVTIENAGAEKTGNFALTIWLDRLTAPSCGEVGTLSNDGSDTGGSGVSASATTLIDSLAPGASLTVNFPFALPAELGEHTAWAFVESQCLLTESDEENNLLSLPYLVAEARIDVTPLSHDFGSVTIGQSSDRVFIVSNLGNLTLDGEASATAPFSVMGGSPYSIAGGCSVTVVVRFSPIEGGEQIGTVTFSGGGGATVTVSGQGLQPAQILVSPPSHDYGSVSVGGSSTFSFTLTNLGSVALEGAATVSAPFTVVSGNPYNIAGGDFAVVELGFSPVVAGDYVATATFTGGGGATVTLRGLAVQPDLLVQSFGLNKEVYAPREVGTATVIIANQGGTSTGVGFAVDFLRHAPGTAGCSPTNFYRRISRPALAAGASDTFVVPFVNYSSTGSFVARVFADSTCILSEGSENNNQATMSYTISVKPDLLVHSLALNKLAYAPGEVGTFTVTIRNQGDAGTGDSWVLRVFQDAPTAVGCDAQGYSHSITCPPLAAAASVTVSQSFTNSASAGTYILRAYADAACVISESDENNNQAAVSYSVGPDLQVLSFSLNKPTYAPREIGTATVTIQNRGGAISGAFSVDLIRHAPSVAGCNPSYYKRINHPPLNPGASTTLAVGFVNYATNGNFVFRIFADSTCSEAESDETNNQAIFNYSIRTPP